MKLLITGAGGQLGRALQRVLVEHNPIALTHAQLDITVLDDVNGAIFAHRPDLVINTAAYTNVDGAETDCANAFLTNALGPRNLALVTADKNIDILHISTDYVFDGRGTKPYDESDPTNPISVYGRSKLEGEQAVTALNPHHYIIRTAWLYHTIGRNFPKTMLTLAERGEVRVVNDQFGSPTFAIDLARAIAQLIELKAYGIYHLAGSGGTNWFDLTCKLYELFGIKARVTPVPTSEFERPAKRPKYSVLTSIREPRIVLPPWEEGLAAFAGEMQHLEN